MQRRYRPFDLTVLGAAKHFQQFVAEGVELGLGVLVGDAPAQQGDRQLQRGDAGGDGFADGGPPDDVARQVRQVVGQPPVHGDRRGAEGVVDGPAELDDASRDTGLAHVQVMLEEPVDVGVAGQDADHT